MNLLLGKQCHIFHFFVGSFSFFFLINFYWSIIALQCCIGFSSTAKRMSYIHIAPLFFFISLPVMYFDRACIKSVDCFGLYGYFSDINSSNPRT